jgi:uroporphyrinogen decarboxylase
MVDGNVNLTKLIDMVEEFNMSIVKRYLDMDVDIMSYPEDLGMQKGPMLSPTHFKKYIKPSYERLMKPARDKGVIVHMHSDGDLHDLIDDIIDGGVEIINLQDLVNGIDWIADRFSGKICVDLDIDRQLITAKGTPKAIDALIHEEVEKIGHKDGGLMMIYGLYPGVPLENVKALMDAMERYAGYYNS